VKELTPFIAAMDGLAEGMVTVGELYQKREYFVPELLICTDALSVDHKNNIGESRRLLGSDVLLFGDIDGFNVLTLGTTDDEIILFMGLGESKATAAMGVACRQIAYDGKVVFINFIKRSYEANRYAGIEASVV